MTDCTFVYRVQNEFGEGPYRGLYGESSADVWADGVVHDIENGRPSPLDTSLRDVVERLNRDQEIGSWRFGFLSLQSLRRWFTPQELENLDSLGFYVYKMKTKEVYNDKYQCMFLLLNNDLGQKFHKDDVYCLFS